MKGGTRVAAGVAAGYLMGRTKKMKLALMVTAAGVTGSLAKSPGELVRRGAAGLGASGAVEGLVSSVRGELKSAAASAATRRIDALSERLSGGSGGSGRPGGDEVETSRGQRDEETEDTGRDSDAEPENGTEPEDETARDSETGRDEGDRARGGRKAEEPESYRPVRRRGGAASGEERKSSGESRSSASRTARRPSRAGSTTTSTAERRTRR